MNPIIGNIILLIITTITFFKYWHYKKYATNNLKIRDEEIVRLNEKTEELSKKLQEANLEMINYKRGGSKFSDNILNRNSSKQEDVKALIEELEILRQEKEDEMKLRLEAEKQIELALQKTQEIQNRMEDWKMIQDASMKDAKGVIIEVVNQLYQKLNKIYKIHNQEEEEMIMEEKELVASGMKNIHEFLEQISKKIEVLEETSLNISKDTKNKCFIPFDQTMIQEVRKENCSENQNSIDGIKKLSLTLQKYLENSDYKFDQNYLLAENYNKNGKNLICDCIFFKKNNLYILDFKAQKYLEEFTKNSTQDNKAALETLKQKISKYINYLANPKYRSSVLEIAGNYNSNFEAANIIPVVSSSKENKILKEIGYLEKFSQFNLKVLTSEEIKNLI